MISLWLLIFIVVSLAGISAMVTLAGLGKLGSTGSSSSSPPPLPSSPSSSPGSPEEPYVPDEPSETCSSFGVPVVVETTTFSQPTTNIANRITGPMGSGNYLLLSKFNNGITDIDAYRYNDSEVYTYRESAPRVSDYVTILPLASVDGMYNFLTYGKQDDTVGRVTSFKVTDQTLFSESMTYMTSEDPSTKFVTGDAFQEARSDPLLSNQCLVAGVSQTSWYAESSNSRGFIVTLQRTASSLDPGYVYDLDPLDQPICYDFGRSFVVREYTMVSYYATGISPAPVSGRNQKPASAVSVWSRKNSGSAFFLLQQALALPTSVNGFSDLEIGFGTSLALTENELVLFVGTAARSDDFLEPGLVLVYTRGGKDSDFQYSGNFLTDPEGKISYSVFATSMYTKGSSHLVISGAKPDTTVEMYLYRINSEGALELDQRIYQDQPHTTSSMAQFYVAEKAKNAVVSMVFGVNNRSLQPCRLVQYKIDCFTTV